MNRNRWILLVFSLVVLALIIGVVCFAVHLYRLSQKTPITGHRFTTILERHGLTVEEYPDPYGNGLVNQVFVGEAESYRIELYICPTGEVAKRFFFDSSASLKNEQGRYSEINLKEYNHFSLRVEERTVYLTRIQNTMVLTIAKKGYEEQAKVILDIIGY